MLGMLGWLPGRSIRLEVVVVSAEVKLLWSFKLARGFLAGQPLLAVVVAGSPLSAVQFAV